MTRKTTPANVLVLGSGGYGTALAITLLTNGCKVTMWGNTPQYTAALRKTRENTKYLPGIKLPAALEFTSDLETAAQGRDLMVMAVPTQHARGVLERLHPHYPNTLPVVSVAKGIEIKTAMRPTQIIREVLGNRMPLGVLSGPSHAEELARQSPSSVVVSSHDEEFAMHLQRLFTTPRHRVYYNTDLTGVELGGALKNIIAVTAGICDGMGLGDNAKAALVTRGMVEIVRLAVALGARKSTFMGLAGIGDLMVTCFSRHGRNRGLGEKIGRGQNLESILAKTDTVAEGVWTTKSVSPLAKKMKVDMPITQELFKILFKDKPIDKALHDLMTRRSKAEVDRDLED